MRNSFFIIIAIALLTNCKFYYISHNQHKAAKSAMEFAEMALIQRDFHKGYSLLSDNFKQAYSFEKFSQLITELHPSLYPLSVTAEEYEPIFGQKAMNIFLYGENGSKKFYYRFVMEGTKLMGYQVAGIFRANGPYPPSKIRQKLNPPDSNETVSSDSFEVQSKARNRQGSDR